MCRGTPEVIDQRHGRYGLSEARPSCRLPVHGDEACSKLTITEHDVVRAQPRRQSSYTVDEGLVKLTLNVTRASRYLSGGEVHRLLRVDPGTPTG